VSAVEKIAFATFLMGDVAFFVWVAILAARK
jgi:heme exporter protein D